MKPAKAAPTGIKIIPEKAREGDRKHHGDDARNISQADPGRKDFQPLRWRPDRVGNRAPPRSFARGARAQERNALLDAGRPPRNEWQVLPRVSTRARAM